ncbi:MAG: diguanylate cyclase [Gammaproteobacteria bacterium]|nr:diguanylate cyclase [Gammaproteobacteria bacterium]MBU1653561.1 diguanylate cyclase [Gammaproteobacteria bacterium]MBU1961903.1 diguanylate cyclase [Gammaproteobacteria bacterium]
MAEQTPTILVVDDTESNIDILLNLLAEYEILVALDGPSALEILEKQQPDIILLDIMMPGMDGYEVCRIIKARQDWEDIPILFITARTDEASILKGFEVGGSDYVTKPFRSKELLARVRTLLGYKLSIDRLRYISVTDELTGAANRRAFFTRGAEMFAQAKEADRLLSALMLDLDRFKAINDTFGHVAGDIALKAFVERVREQLAPGDLLGRLGGEEFAVVPAKRSPDEAINLAEAIRRSVEARKIDVKGDIIPLTVSIGIAFSDGKTESFDALLSVADGQLYAAKHDQRNCIHFLGQSGKTQKPDGQTGFRKRR